MDMRRPQLRNMAPPTRSGEPLKPHVGYSNPCSLPSAIRKLCQTTSPVSALRQNRLPSLLREKTTSPSTDGVLTVPPSCARSQISLG